MEKMFTGSETIAEIVSNFPGASNLFKEARIDFCCGGDRTLSAALQQKNINEEPFIQRLNDSYEEMTNRGTDQHTDWRKIPLSDMVDHIVNKHHVYLRKELPLLSEFVTKILRVHGAAHEELAKLHKLFHHMKTEFDQHLISEEEVLFPLIKQYEANPSPSLLDQAIQGLDELEKDHSAVGDFLKEMRSVTNDYLLPSGACRTYTLTFQKLEELESDVFEHVHLENNILFPRITEKA